MTDHKDQTEVKAADMTVSEMDRWLLGEIPRRLLVLPFFGPIPGGKAGVDLDGEWFDEDTDIIGGFSGLKATRERLVDWHHDGRGVPDAAQWMKGAILGKIVLDDGPSEFAHEGEIYEGIAADWWAKAGERRLSLIRSLQQRGTPIFGSSMAVSQGIRKAASGHIEVWPLYRHAISTSPQNTFAVVPSLKAVLTSNLSFDGIGLAALKAALVGWDALAEVGLGLSDGSQAAQLSLKAGRVLSAANEAELRKALDALAVVLAKLIPAEPNMETPPNE